MNLKNPTLFAALILMSIATMISSCGDDGGGDEPTEPAITAVSPESGPVGTTVTITGHHFTETSTVKFNGTAAVVSNASHEEIVTTVPEGATTGKITVEVDGVTLTSPNDFVVTVVSTVTSIDPVQGVAGTVVVIEGTNFSTTLAQNVVKFGGNAQATVIDATSTELVVEVPEAATTGAISVTVNGSAATGTPTFTILAPTITSVDPMLGGEGLAVKIKGTNFSTSEEFNHVKFNNVTATVTAAAADQLTVTVPAGATSGKITVKVGPNTATSPEDFFVCNNAELAIFSGQATANGASTNYEFTLINYGKETIDLAQWNYQNYASIDAVFNGGDAGGGGSTLAGHTPRYLATGESTKISSSAGVNSAPYTYYIFTLNSNTPVTECLTNNNELAVQIIK